MRPFPFLLAALFIGATVNAFGQTDSITLHRAASVLTKETAQAVFAQLGRQPKGAVAKLIADSLKNCPDGCDAFAVIDRKDPAQGWKAVRERLALLQRSTTNSPLMALPEAQLLPQFALIMRQFAAENGKDNVTYKKALTPAVQQAILAKVGAELGVSGAVETSEGEQPDTSAVIADPQPGAPVSQSSFEILPLLLGFLAGLLAGAAAVYFLLYRGQKAENQLLYQKYDQARANLQDAQFNINKRLTDAQEKARKYDELVAEAGPDAEPLAYLRSLKSTQPPVNEPTLIVPPTLPPLTVTSESVPPVPVVAEPAKLPVPVKNEVFFVPPPSPEGYFDASQQSAVLSPTTAYRLGVDGRNPGVARFRFEAEAARLERFLTYRNYFIDPACDSENNFSDGVTRVQTVREGEAVLENGQWRVQKKALIRYQ